MKNLQVTRKSIKNSGKKVIGVGYCDLQKILKFMDRKNFCSGIYGWDCDNYYIGEYIISTGYRPIKNDGYLKRTDIKNYDKKIDKIINNYKLSYTEKQEKAKKLLLNILNEHIR